MRTMVIVVLLSLALAAAAQGQPAYSTNQLESSSLIEMAQRALFPATTNGVSQFVLPVNTGTPSAAIASNAAILQYQADKKAFPFLATLPHQGFSAYIAALKPCGMIGPHIHATANEQYVIISGVMQGGIAGQGNESASFTVYPGQSMVVPQGLVHYNLNAGCTPNVFVQVYGTADPGTIGMNPALAALSAGNPEAGLTANFTQTKQPLAPFALDPTCLKTCGLPSTGAPGNGFSGLSADLQAFLGVGGMSSPPGSAPASG